MKKAVYPSGEEYLSRDAYLASLYDDEVQDLGRRVREVIINKFHTDIGIEKSTDIAQIITEERP